MFTEEQKELEPQFVERPTNSQLGIDDEHEAYCSEMDMMPIERITTATIRYWNKKQKRYTMTKEIPLAIAEKVNAFLRAADCGPTSMHIIETYVKSS